MSPFSFRSYPVLGSELHVLVGCETVALAERAQLEVLGEIRRLEAMLSTYRRDTPLSRWMRGEIEQVPSEVVTVLALAQDWFAASGGAYHPGLGRLRDRWREAEREGRPPARAECRRLAAPADGLPFSVQPEEGVGQLVRTGDCSHLDLDGLAKGWIVDRAAEAGLGPEVGWVMVNVGGDLRLAGSGTVRVAIENPISAIDNGPPLGVVTMSAGGLASSGSARRGFQVGSRWFGHVLDPRTGWPVEDTAGATVIAHDTTTADALATMVGVSGLDDPRVAALLADTEAAALDVSISGAVRLSRQWGERVESNLVASG